VPKSAEDTNQEDEIVKERDQTQIITWLERLTLPELCQE